MKTTGTCIALLALAATILLSSTSIIKAAPATKRGWWIRVNTQTEASTITFQIGTSKKDRHSWRTWKSSDETEFAVPPEFLTAEELYIHATSNPSDKKAYFSVYYNGDGVKHFDFDGAEDHQMKQSDRDKDCK